MKIRLRSTDDLNDFCNICSKFDADINARTGRFVVDAKSPIGLMYIGAFGQDIEIEYLGNDTNRQEFYDSIERFEVNQL